MVRRLLLTFLTLFLAAFCGPGQAWERNFVGDDLPVINQAELPPQARETLRLITEGGPFPYPRDGIPFGNYEKRLPLRPRNYYREYTVPTLGERNRGARRIISGDRGERYYTPDHYRHFWRIQSHQP